MIVAVVRLAGDCAGAAIAELEAAAAAGGARVRIVQGPAELADAQLVCVVGGAGAVLAGDSARALHALAVPVLGVCGGAFALVRIGLLDAAPVDAGGGARTCMVEGRATPFTAALPVGRSLRLGESHVGFAAGEQIESEGRVVLRACGAHGEPGTDVVAVGSGNVVGVAAHLGADGRSLILAALAWLRQTPARLPI